MTDLESAIKMLKDNNYCCVVKGSDYLYTSSKPGIGPILDLIEKGDNIRGFCAADRIVGKAAALMYVLLGIDTVYGTVMSKTAVEVFEKHGIIYKYDILTDYIVNRTKTGECPMEMTVKEITEPNEAFAALKKTTERLKNNN